MSVLFWHEKIIHYVKTELFEQYMQDLCNYLSEKTLGFELKFQVNLVKAKKLFYITFATNEQWTSNVTEPQKLIDAWKQIMQAHCQQQGFDNVQIKLVAWNKEPTKPKKKTTKISNPKLLQAIKGLCKIVKQTQKPQKTNPLDADQRALVHNLIHQYSFLTSKSVGKNKNCREIIISYKKPKPLNKPTNEPVS